MAWYGLWTTATGDLVSVGTEAMFPGGDPANVPAGTTRIDFGATRPDFAAQRWNPATRALEPRPAPVLVDRVDDFMAAFAADTDYSAVFGALTANRKTQIQAGLRRVLAARLNGMRMRQQAESADL